HGRMAPLLSVLSGIEPHSGLHPYGRPHSHRIHLVSSGTGHSPRLAPFSLGPHSRCDVGRLTAARYSRAKRILTAVSCLAFHIAPWRSIALHCRCSNYTGDKKTMTQRIAILGAGPSGLAQLRAFESGRKAGEDVPEI